MRSPPPRLPTAHFTLLRFAILITLLVVASASLSGCCGILENALAEMGVGITVTPPDSATPSPEPVTDGAAATASPSPDDPAGDQARIVEMYGMPDTFTAAYDPDEDVYIEAWDYYAYGVTWLFNNSTCTGFDVCALDENLEPFYTLWPGEVGPGTTLASLSSRMGQRPAAGIDLDATLAATLGGEDLAVYWFDRGMMVIFEGDELRYLSTRGTAMGLVAAPEGEEG